jgi:hypothetical protein
VLSKAEHAIVETQFVETQITFCSTQERFIYGRHFTRPSQLGEGGRSELKNRAHRSSWIFTGQKTTLGIRDDPS